MTSTPRILLLRGPYPVRARAKRLTGGRPRAVPRLGMSAGIDITAAPCVLASRDGKLARTILVPYFSNDSDILLFSTDFDFSMILIFFHFLQIVIFLWFRAFQDFPLILPKVVFRWLWFSYDSSESHILMIMLILIFFNDSTWKIIRKCQYGRIIEKHHFGRISEKWQIRNNHWKMSNMYNQWKMSAWYNHKKITRL